MSVPAVGALPAATVVLVREIAGLEVLMVERSARGFFGGLMVFPGGGVDECDHSDLAAEVVAGEEADQVSRAAALRELAEETSIAITSDGLRQAPEGRGQELFAEFEAASLTLDGSALTLISRWVTPPGAPRRYDTRFYLAEASGDPPIRLDETELVSWIWIDPAKALNRTKAGEWSMFNPTIAHLRWLAKRSSFDDARRSASGAAGRMLPQPEVMDDGSLVPVALPSGDE